MDEADLTEEERMAESGNGRPLEWFGVLEEGDLPEVVADAELV
jgi:hypothetical protein